LLEPSHLVVYVLLLYNASVMCIIRIIGCERERASIYPCLFILI